MNTRKTTFLLIVIAAFLLPVSEVTAQEGAEPGSFSQMLSGLNPANWKMPEFKNPLPKILPTKTEQDRVITKKDGLVQEVSKTAKSSWQRTKTTLNPKRLIPAGFKQGQTTKSEPKKEPGFFSRLFSPPSTAPVEKKSVTDFLKQDPVR